MPLLEQVIIGLWSIQDGLMKFLEQDHSHIKQNH